MCYCSTNIGDIEASCWQSGQGSILVEGSEEAVSSCGDVGGVETSFWKTRQGSIIVEGHKEVIPWSRSTHSEISRQIWHIGELYLVRCGIDFGHERFGLDGKKRPSTCPTRQGEGDGVGTRSGIGMEDIGGQISFLGAVSSVDGVSIGEVLIDLHRLTGDGDLRGELDIFCTKGTGTWRLFSVIVDITDSRLVI